MRFPRHLVLTAIPMAMLVSAGPVRAQMVATITLESTDSKVERQPCPAAMQDMPEGSNADMLIVRVLDGGGATVTEPLTVRVNSEEVFKVAKGDSVGRALVKSPIANAWIDITSGDAAPICTTRIPEEVPDEEEREVDPAFRVLAGVEYISTDAFQERDVHVPAAAQWTIPIRVTTRDAYMAELRRERDERDRERVERVAAGKESVGDQLHPFLRRLNPRRGHNYSILTSTAEYTRIPHHRTFFSCVRKSAVLKAGGASPATTDDCPVVEKGDSLVGFSEEKDSAGYLTPRTWRVTGNLRWEKNTLWADRDVFFGPAVVLGFQTDPGLAAPDFFPIFLFGGSLTQVEIDPEYFEERLQLQVLWGRSPNYARKVISLADTTTVERDLKATYTNRWYVSMQFQPASGYFLRGSAEFGKDVPDMARLSAVTALDIGRIIGGIIGQKPRLPRE
jgi:hypothetical protein